MSFQSESTSCLGLTTELSRLFLLFDPLNMVESCGLSRSFNVRDHLTTDFNNCQFTTLRTLEWYKHNPQTICGLPILQRFIAKQKHWVGVSTFGNVSSESLEERATIIRLKEADRY